MAFAPTVALDYLRRAHEGDRLGHAYLLVGEEAALQLAWQLAGMVVRAPEDKIRAHPDVHLVEPESKSRRIVVEQMRELEHSLRLRASAAGGRKVGIVREADRLQAQASNAFLKTLEEPPAASLLLLVTSQPEALMETIVSRCLKVVVWDPDGVQGAARSEQESGLLELLARHERPATDGQGTSAVSTAYRFLREFSALLASVRGRLQGESEKALDKEETRYAQTTDGGWLADREAYYKALTEARYVAERARLVEVLVRWWGDALRQHSVAVTQGDESRRFTTDVLRRLAVLDELRENFDRNIQEALALEVAFLQVFGS